MASPAPLTTQAGVGWQASLALGFAAKGGRTALTHRRQRGPLAVQRAFYPEGAPCHLYLLHPPGGVVGGDVLDIRVEVAAGAHALITTPGAAKFYRSAGATALQTQTLTIADGGCLEWLPQENILFPGAAVQLATRIELQGGARCIAWEVQCLGRPANLEPFSTGHACWRLGLYRDGRPLLCERLAVQVAGDLQRPTGLRGWPVLGTLLAGGADAAAVQCARAAVAGLADGLAITRVDDLLVARYLGASTETARRCFCAIWQALRPLLLGRPASLPRIWST